MGGGGGFFGAIKRVAGGGSLFMTEYRAIGGPGEVAFATRVPGHIVPVQVGRGYEYLVHRHGFLCATAGVQLGVGFQQSLGAGIFGGDGFLLQKVSGYGTAWLELSGEVVTRDLAPRRDPPGAPRSRRRLPVQRLLPDHADSGHPQHDLRRRRDLPGRPHRPRPRLAADPADRTPGEPADGVHAVAGEPSGRRVGWSADSSARCCARRRWSQFTGAGVTSGALRHSIGAQARDLPKKIAALGPRDRPRERPRKG